MRGKIAIQQDHHICGRFDEAFGTRDIYRFGLHLGVEIARSKTPKIVVASDRRPLNRTHVHLAVGGLQGADCDVMFLGCAPYPMVMHASRILDVPHALMVTSAEAEDGTIGFRVVLGGEPMPSFELKERFEASRTDRFDAISGNGRLFEVNLAHTYLRWLLHGARPANDGLAVLWDAGNGATADIVTTLATVLPGRHVVVNQGGDAPLIGRTKDSALRELGGSVVQGGFDVGVAFSGDGTGVLMVDNLGTPIREWHRLHILSTRRGRQPIAGNGLLASRRKARGDAIKHALKVLRAISESGTTAATLRQAVDAEPVVLGKGSIAPGWVNRSVADAANS
ncbi:hypothetical protein KL86APRO_11142 [uncultured Alphaproteobacteria bacterium]|uniref:Alpha-D-phosphohexomutase alpha/beta/alpha domain-containing protein n=1 Tax=uncultured Alphaproteobacteria bacterium TaxID=91750 RepID=A0A212JJ69_9PROT|nr:hypothetical protein KL86APRO_11142 [uncultured Alphaproteobacteria bacterium]